MTDHRDHRDVDVPETVRELSNTCIYVYRELAIAEDSLTATEISDRCALPYRTAANVSRRLVEETEHVDRHHVDGREYVYHVVAE
jgi:hypothetical protein